PHVRRAAASASCDWRATLTLIRGGSVRPPAGIGRVDQRYAKEPRESLCLGEKRVPFELDRPAVAHKRDEDTALTLKSLRRVQQAPITSHDVDRGHVGDAIDIEKLGVPYVANPHDAVLDRDSGRPAIHQVDGD